MNQGQPAEAALCYRQALRLQPNHPDAHINLGNALKDQGKLAEAIASFQEALRLNPQHSSAFNNLGNAPWTRDNQPKGPSAFARL